MRSRYWTCSKFADWLRGTPKPGAATSEGWDAWNEEAKSKHPFRFWLADDVLDYVQNFVNYIPDKLYGLKYYINNRWVSRTHSLTAHPRDIKPGDWRDVGDRFLPCLFNELVDFVEIEVASNQIAWGGDKVKAKYKAPFWASGWFRWRVWRCPQAGLDSLEWQRNLVWGDDEYLDKDDPRYGQPTHQAIKAQEILDLYVWWTVTRPARPDAYEASGWSAYCEASREASGGKLRWGGDRSPELKEMSTKAHELLHKMEEAYETEDEEMMIRLIKVRQGLWT